ncbi:MAG TPA: hypothetical protein VFM48_01885 [Aquabacterium sp.]|nr:hypothetical protein [Aquabacterium sp.]
MDINDEQDMLPDAEVELIDPEEKAAQIAEKLQAFGSKLSKRRDDWIQARAAIGVDKRWAQDLDAYHGRDSANKMASNLMVSVEQGFPVTQQQRLPQRSTVYIGLTRQKTNAAEARLADILMPSDERFFAIAPTPIPRLANSPAVQTLISRASQMAMSQMANEAPAKLGSSSAPGPGEMPGMSDAATQAMSPSGQGAVGQQQPIIGQGAVQPSTGQQAQAAQPAPGANIVGSYPQMSPEELRLLKEQQDARARADSMQQEIDDAFVECDAQGEMRKVIHDAAMLGTGVFKGPVVLSRTRKAWRKQVDASGAATYIMEKVTELKPASFRIDPRLVYPDPACGDNVQDGRGIFEKSSKTPKQVRDLAKQPMYLKDQLRAVLEEGPQRSKALVNIEQTEDKDVMQEELFEHWIYTGEIDKDDLIAAGVDVSEDELEVVSAVVEMINSTVVRAYLNPLEDGSLPYDFFPWEKVSGSVWGYGIPYLMRAQQSVINSAWRQMMDNAGVTAGPQIVVKPSLIKPADQQWAITPRKIWYATDDTQDVRAAFTSVEFSSHQNELAGIIKLAEDLCDQETGIPQIAAGSQGAAPDTVGGMQMLMNGANVVLRRLVKQWDDFITKPHVRRYYDYFMAYSDKDEIKGDFMVNVLGSSSLVVRDIQNQAVTNMLALGTNPAYAPMIRTQKLFEKALRAQHIDPQEIMLTPAEIAQQAQQAQQGQQPDPRVQAAQVRAEADIQRTQSQSAANAAEMQFRQKMAEQDYAAHMAELQLTREIEMLKLASKQNVALDQIKAQLAATGIQARAKQDMQAAELQLKAQTGSGI